ncbi:hypothetical protein EDC04DRAFT_2866370 [Pisolithus marmoratus]|nr:hypothetical protein EDC04DRAFT_2866370 [Pisolithus marmoratus]
MAHILLGCLVSKVPNDILTCYKALLDFIIFGTVPSHDDNTLGYMEAALTLFHKHKEVFISLGIQDHFNVPKFHSLLHYAFECLHIDLAKEGWHASNTSNLIPQMTREFAHPTQAVKISLAKHPAVHTQPIQMIEELHSMPHFSRDLKYFLSSLLPPWTSNHSCLDILDAWHSYKLKMDKLGNNVDVQEGVETIKAKPGDGGRFNNVVVAHSTTAESTGLQGMKIGCLQVIFKLHTKISLSDAPCTWPKEWLAYVEWYKISQIPGEHHKMYFISKPHPEPTSGIVLLRMICQGDIQTDE